MQEKTPQIPRSQNEVCIGQVASSPHNQWYQEANHVKEKYGLVPQLAWVCGHHTHGHDIQTWWYSHYKEASHSVLLRKRRHEYSKANKKVQKHEELKLTRTIVSRFINPGEATNANVTELDNPSKPQEVDIRGRPPSVVPIHTKINKPPLRA